MHSTTMEDPAFVPVAEAADILAQLPALITVGRAAPILGISKAAAYRAAAEGHLPVYRMGRRVWVITAKLRERIGV